MCKLTDTDVKATADVMIDMLIRAIILNTDGKANSKNTHTSVNIWEDTTYLDTDVAPNRKDKITGDDCRRGTI